MATISAAARSISSTLKIAGICAALSVICAGQPVQAAEYTNVMSAADKDDVWDGVLGVRYEWSRRQSRISREYGCDSTTAGCPASGGVVTRTEMDSVRTSNIMNIDARLGLYHDLELFFTLPFAISDQTSLKFAPGVSRSNSTVFPDSGPYFFDLPNTSNDRKSFGDMQVGLKYGPMNQFKNPHHPTLVLAFIYTAPTGEIRKAGGTGTGEGLHKFHFEIAASRRIAFFEPYFGLFGSYMAPATTRDTLFATYDASTQKNIGPGPEIGVNFGAEFYVWNQPKNGKEPKTFATIDVGFNARYRFQGREYTDLFDAFGTSSCAGKSGCVSPLSSKNLLAYDRTRDGLQQPITVMDGITDVSPYGIFSTWLGVNVQPIKYLSMSFRFTYGYETGHFLTNADTGMNRDTTNQTIELSNSKGQNEFNPVYNSDVDLPGNRFYSEGANIYGIMLMLTGRY
jgi:hypothetical protein